jgi:uncharacterized protein YdaU (DUF1376 family)
MGVWAEGPFLARVHSGKSLEPMHYYSHHVGDYDRDTAFLSLVEHGAYGKLMRSYYATERPLPANAEYLWRICGAMTKEEKLAVSRVAERFFKLDGDVLRHKRIDKEIESFHAQLETASKAGKASAESRQRKRNARSTPVQRPLDSGCNGTSTNQEPLTNNQEREHSLEVLPKGCAKRKPTGWPSSESQARGMAEPAGVHPDLAATFWLHYDGMGYWPQGSFVSAMKAKQGFRAQDLADKTVVAEAGRVAWAEESENKPRTMKL